MPSETLTPERILEATEDVLRRFGPTKATVVDVAKALGVSHGSVYRHFHTKAALHEAVTQRWLDQSHAKLGKIAADKGPAPDRVRAWLTELFAAKRRKAGKDPELFATYLVLVEENSGLIERHTNTMMGQLAAMINSGIRNGAFAETNEIPTARAIWDATSRFHDPVYARHWFDPGADKAFDALVELILRGLRA